MYYRALKNFTFHDQRGNPLPIRAGQLVSVLMRNDERELLAKGLVGLEEFSAFAGRVDGYAESYALTVRVGIFLNTSPNYSGGRIHMYQYAWCLADLGAEVYMFTDGRPRWVSDYPVSPRLKILQTKDAAPPNDLDLVVTDSKTEFGTKALNYKRTHPGCKLVCFNFETPNWVAKYVPSYAEQLHQMSDVFLKADYLIANSAESARHLLEWLNSPAIPCGVLQPAVNGFALEQAKSKPSVAGVKPRPYAVWSARGPAYKGMDIAIAAVNAQPEPFDLVLLGTPSGLPKDKDGHRLIVQNHVPDVTKYQWMRGARVVLAPSLFEGFGMVPGEALASGAPAVVYDLPVLRQEYGDRLIYAKWNDRDDFIAKVTAEVKNPLPAHKREALASASVKTFGLDTMRERTSKLLYHNIKGRRVSVQLISYWGFLSESLESVYPFADEILVAFGPTEHAAALDDGSLRRITEFPDPDRKIKLCVRERWVHKMEMRNWCLDNSSGNYLILLDGDEVWTGLDKWLEADIKFGCPRWLNLWRSGKHWIHDGDTSMRNRWGVRMPDGWGSTCPHYRCSYLRRSYRFSPHPVLQDMNNGIIHMEFSQDAALRVPETVIYHLGHALPHEVMDAKHQYYIDRDGDDPGRQNRRTVWREWNGQVGPMGDGTVEAIVRPLPEIVERAVRSAAEMKA